MEPNIESLKEIAKTLENPRMYKELRRLEAVLVKERDSAKLVFRQKPCDEYYSWNHSKVELITAILGDDLRNE